MWIRRGSHCGNVRSEDPRGCRALNPQQLPFLFPAAPGGLCPSPGLGCGLLHECPRAGQKGAGAKHLGASTHQYLGWNLCLLLCGIDAIGILGLDQILPVFAYFIPLLSLFSGKRNQVETLVFQNKYPDRLSRKLHMVCIMDLFSRELTEKNCWSQGRPSLINPQCQGCLWCFMCGLFVFLVQDFVFPRLPEPICHFIIPGVWNCYEEMMATHSSHQRCLPWLWQTQGDRSWMNSLQAWSCLPKPLLPCRREGQKEAPKRGRS